MVSKELLEAEKIVENQGTQRLRELQEKGENAQCEETQSMEDLQEAGDEAARFNSVGLMGIVAQIEKYLNDEKQIPHFYYTNAAIKAGLPSTICRQDRINKFLSGLKRPSDKEIREITEILLMVLQKLLASPEQQTYQDAVLQLKERIKHLKDDRKLSHNAIATRAQVSHKTLADIIDDDMQGHNRHQCPWDILKKLENAENEIQEQKDYTAQRQKIMQPGRNNSKINPKIPGEYEFINPDEPCLYCSAKWTHLHRTGEDAWGNIIMTCITCNRDNLINVKKIAKRPKALFRPYKPCPWCKAPWENQIRDCLSENGIIIYTCNVCENENVIVPINGRTAVTTGGR